jgi:hypothetical protein
VTSRRALSSARPYAAQSRTRRRRSGPPADRGPLVGARGPWRRGIGLGPVEIAIRFDWEVTAVAVKVAEVAAGAIAAPGDHGPRSSTPNATAPMAVARGT